MITVFYLFFFFFLRFLVAVDICIDSDLSARNIDAGVYGERAIVVLTLVNGAMLGCKND